MKKYKTLLLLLILCMVVCIFAGTTYAWFVKVKRTGAVYFKSGEVEYSIDSDGFENNFIEKDFIVPGENLIKENSVVYFNNHSSISSRVRILIKVIVDDKHYVLGQPNGSLLYEMASEEGYSWKYIEEKVEQGKPYVGYWYCEISEINEDNTTTISEILPPIDGGNVEEIPVLKMLKLDGSKFGNTVAGKDVKIHFYFQARQSDYADWIKIGQIETTLEQ